MQQWSWCIAADVSGQWLLTQGHAEVSRNSNKLLAALRFSADTEVCQHVDADIDEEDGTVHAHVSSPDPAVPSCQLQGFLYH